MDSINAQLKEYIEKNIFPKYNKYYSHGMIHINSVINNMLMLANIKRQISTSIKNYPQKKSFDEHFKNCYEYTCKRINDNGKFNLWTNNPILVERRDNFQKDFLNKEYAKLLYKEEWDRISADGTKEKIINFYEDY